VADQPVELVEYDPRWVDSFAEQQAKLAGTLAPWLAGPIEHIGSTAVPGLRAKPVVDILCPVRSLMDARQALSLLEEQGWLHWAQDPERHFRMWFLRPRPEARTHHLHLIEDPARVHSLLTFRDALRSDTHLRKDYEALKTQLAQRYRADRDAYTDAKTDFIEQVLRLKREGGRP